MCMGNSQNKYIGSNSTLKKLIAIVMTCRRKNMTIAKKWNFFETNPPPLSHISG